MRDSIFSGAEVRGPRRARASTLLRLVQVPAGVDLLQALLALRERLPDGRALDRGAGLNVR